LAILAYVGARGGHVLHLPERDLASAFWTSRYRCQ
jgi:hypothetical protein